MSGMSIPWVSDAAERSNVRAGAVDFVRDNRGRYWIIDPKSETRYETGGPNSGSFAAAAALYGNPGYSGTRLTGWNEHRGGAVNFFGGPNEMEKVVSGRKPNPFTGKRVPNPQDIRAGDGTVFKSTARPSSPNNNSGGGGDDAAPSNDPEAFAAQAGYGWLRGALLDKFGELWDETGDPTAALSRLRDTGVYEKTFRGIKRDDGTLRMDENEYKSFQVGVQSMASEFGFRVKPGQFVNMVENEVNPQEFAQAATDAFQRFNEPGADKDNRLTQQFINQFAESGSAVEALEQVRDSKQYENVFAGNIREDGTLRMDETEYFAYKRGFERAFLSRGLNPRPFEAKGRLKDVVEAELSIQEIEGRLNAVEQGVLSNTSETLQFFTDNYGEQGINFLSQRGDRATALAMAVDPDIGKDILSQRISASQIGGEAALQGFRRSLNRAEKLAKAGVNQGQAREFFGMASQNLAGIGATTARFRRGGTNLGQLEDAFLLGEGVEQQRIGRALEAEQSSFSSRMDTRRDRDTGGLSGLRQR